MCFRNRLDASDPSGRTFRVFKPRLSTGIMIIRQLQTESLGHSSYLVVSQGEKTCAIVDPSRYDI